MLLKKWIGLFLGLLVAFSAQAQVYRWTDAKGRQHVTDSPPPRSATESRFVDISQGTRKVTRTVKRPTRSAKNFKYFTVMLYTSQECGQPCDLARTLLKERGIAFNEKVIKDELDEQWIIKQVGENLVPSMTVGNDIFKGWNEEQWHVFLDKAGFPKLVKSAENKEPTELDKNQNSSFDAHKNASPVPENHAENPT